MIESRLAAIQAADPAPGLCPNSRQHGSYPATEALSTMHGSINCVDTSCVAVENNPPGRALFSSSSTTCSTFAFDVLPLSPYFADT